MRKRKERRIAALANAGRRVKLDLLPEPSGDFGVSSEHDKVGDKIDPTQHPGLPESPSSSGEQPQNPLQLLGQYSDDELDDESNKDFKQANLDGFRGEHDSKDEGTHNNLCESVDGDSVKVASVKLEQHDIDKDSCHVDASKIMESDISRATDDAAHNDISKDLVSCSPKQNSNSGNPHEKMIGDVSLGWKMVLHEESNQYYYWNVETGETSWEVPNDWAQRTEMGLEQNIDVNENTEIVSAGPNVSDSTILASLAATDIDGSTVDHLISQSKVVNYSGHCMDVSTLGTESNPGDVDEKSSAVNGLLSDGNLAAVDNSVQYSVDDQEDNMAVDLPARLVNMCECLLDRLKSLAGSRSQLDRHDWISKYTLEIGIRHYDISSLISCGSSVLPFWEHSERQLKQVENAINVEIYQMAISAQMDIAEAICSSPDILKAKTERNHGLESDAKKREENVVHSTSEVAITTSVNYLSDAGKSSCNVTDNINNAHEELPSTVGLARDSLNSAVAYEHTNQTSLSGEPVSEQGYHEEDIDMDVDMDVEDETTTSSMALGGPSHARDFSAAPPYEQLIQRNSPVDYQLLMSSNASTLPPPPDEGWIPPPPPDDDLVPPPPPDNELDPPQPPNEPTMSLYSALPSYTGIGQPFSYCGQYNIAYPDSSFQYYGDAVTDVLGNNLYGHADGYQVVLPETSVYYGVPHTYVDTAPITAPVSYAPPVPGTARLESPQFHDESDPNSSVISSVNAKCVDAFTNDGSTANVDISGVHEEAAISSLLVPLNSATIQAPALILVKDSMSELAASATATATATATVVAASSTTSKPPSKVLRSKKRTVPIASSLRSNKKVSSMVDKWKAAKEELNVKEDEEPDNQLEILEKKRQREIKEWRDQQIASGEAKSNANFQPLGGDWRERVKRRRAKTAKEVVESASETQAVENKQPDLTELSKGLPSLWQAYWDESTQKVYYGHKITSETTWTRPTK